ncbi:unnamed protein product, partial [Rotaria magnacalcarata]
MIIGLTLPITMWNVNDCQYRTNNICEGFHNRLNRRIERAHANIWSFIKSIVSEEARFQHLHVQMNTGATHRSVSSSSSGIQKRIDILMARYKNNDID